MSNEFLIIKLQNENLLDLYCFFLKFKYSYSSGYIYPEGQPDLAKRTNLHLKTVRKRLDEMIARGWAKMDRSGGVSFIGRVELMDKEGISRQDQFYKARVELHPGDEVKEIKVRLQTKLIEANLRRQEHNDRNKNQGDGNGPVLSCEGIGKILNVSPATACRYKKDAEKLGLLKIAKRYLILARGITEKFFLNFREVFPKNCFWIGGRVVQRKADEVRQRFWAGSLEAFELMENDIRSFQNP